jgi:hypothetical protein
MFDKSHTAHTPEIFEIRQMIQNSTLRRIVQNDLNLFIYAQ